jgi:hypothetical protein
MAVEMETKRDRFLYIAKHYIGKSVTFIDGELDTSNEIEAFDQANVVEIINLPADTYTPRSNHLIILKMVQEDKSCFYSTYHFNVIFQYNEACYTSGIDFVDKAVYETPSITYEEMIGTIADLLEEGICFNNLYYNCR